MESKTNKKAYVITGGDVFRCQDGLPIISVAGENDEPIFSLVIREGKILTEGDADVGANVFMDGCKRFFHGMLEKMFLEMKAEMIKAIKDEPFLEWDHAKDVQRFITKIEGIKFKI